MAPVKMHKVMLTVKDKIKMRRKPVVEKLRRDRISTSIEKLKALLEKELQAQQPCSKLEKADILETAVCYLKENARVPAQSYAEGFTRCLQEALRFLSLHMQPAESQQNVVIISHFARLAAGLPLQSVKAVQQAPSPVVQVRSLGHSASKCVSGSGGRQLLWRPW